MTATTAAHENQKEKVYNGDCNDIKTRSHNAPKRQEEAKEEEVVVIDDDATESECVVDEGGEDERRNGEKRENTKASLLPSSDEAVPRPTKENSFNSDTNIDNNCSMVHMVQKQEETIRVITDLSQTLTKLMAMQIQQQQKDSEEDDNVVSKDLLSVDRATVRLDGLEVYAVVSALTVATSIACFEVYGGGDNAGKDTTPFNHMLGTDQITRKNILGILLNTFFLAVSGGGIIAGLHATLVFSLMTMYGRTAVGVSHDEAFVEFFVQTGRVRYRGFHTFRLSLYCFLIQVLFTITSKASPFLRPTIVVISIYAMFWVYKDTQSVIDKASTILFQNLDAGKKLQRTVSDVSIKLDKVAENKARITLQGMKNATGNIASGGTRRKGISNTGNGNGKRTPVRSKSGIVVYDVEYQDSRPAPRRGGRKPRSARITLKDS